MQVKIYTLNIWASLLVDIAIRKSPKIFYAKKKVSP